MKMDNTIKIIAKEIKKKNIPKYSNVQNNNFIVQSNKLSFFFIIIISFWIKVLGFPTAVPHIASNLFPLDTFVKRKSRKKHLKMDCLSITAIWTGSHIVCPSNIAQEIVLFFCLWLQKRVFSVYFTLCHHHLFRKRTKKKTTIKVDWIFFRCARCQLFQS